MRLWTGVVPSILLPFLRIIVSILGKARNLGGTFIFSNHISKTGWDGMSENSGNSSVSFQDMFSRMKLNRTQKQPQQRQPQQQAQPQQAAVRKPRPVTPEYDTGVRQLDKSGYAKYNIDDDAIYISKVPESVMFNDGEATAVKAQPGVIVGLYRTEPVVEVKKKETAPAVSVDKMFSNVERGSDTNITAYVGTYRNGVMTKTSKLTDF